MNAGRVLELRGSLQPQFGSQGLAQAVCVAPRTGVGNAGVTRAVPSGVAAQGCSLLGAASAAHCPLSGGSGAAQELRVTLLCLHGDAPADPTCVSS